MLTPPTRTYLFIITSGGMGCIYIYIYRVHCRLSHHELHLSAFCKLSKSLPPAIHLVRNQKTKTSVCLLQTVKIFTICNPSGEESKKPKKKTRETNEPECRSRSWWKKSGHVEFHLSIPFFSRQSSASSKQVHTDAKPGTQQHTRANRKANMSCETCLNCHTLTHS